MNEDRDIVLFRIDRRLGLLILAALAVAFGGIALAQQLTLTTSYPVPSGIYNQLTTSGNWGAVPANTTFNLNAGNTILVPPTNPSGSVGIGTLTPTSMLSVAGGVQLGNDVSACTAAKAGTLIWASGGIQYCNGSAWGPLVGVAPTFSPPTLTYSYQTNEYMWGMFWPGSGGYWLLTAGTNATIFANGKIHVAGSGSGSGWQSCGYDMAGYNIMWCSTTGLVDGASVDQDGVTYTW